MQHLSYLAVVGGILAGSIWLELVVRTRVLRRFRRLALAIAPVLAVFVVWDAYAIAAGHWTFNAASTTGITLPGRIPLEELLFFLVVPLAGVLTFEGVRAVRGWRGGDEP